MSAPENYEGEDVFRFNIQQQFERGISDSRDPQNAHLPDLALRCTTLYSPWYTGVCPECTHKFREKDHVRLCPKCGQVYHDDHRYNLHCWSNHFKNGSCCKESQYDLILEKHVQGCDFQLPESVINGNLKRPAQLPASSPHRIWRVTKQFLKGLEGVWKPFGKEEVYEVREDDPIITHRCPWCRFNIRMGDRVVKCPCGRCETYFHQDIFRRLTCWNAWNGSKGKDYCPTTGVKIER